MAPKDWRAPGPDPLPPVLRAALEVFARHGYHGASIRTIADAAGLSVPGLYHHYPSKQAILRAVAEATMTEMLEHTTAAADDAGSDPAARFDNIVECLARFHMARRDHAFVASTEMRSMEPEVRARHVAQRDTQQKMLEDAIEAGVESGVFECAHTADAARAVASLCVSIASWYRTDGPLSPDEIVQRHLGFARGMVGAARA
ncbi:TetR/AcrR family transcriptional regulator [Dietzia psychralcaliphila]|uniref:TetR family transcriptional regulator n=1 Tax=Dietzia psychralcaliphila TaxID=139021 RepID=A0AAD0JUC3_9ACTN|nr:TetR/AcrR family transcriptional regulator [Dietzia psychralcaliphila]AWH95886.1 TetR family transcriptional regulator [Dietzia psychralcaliphila]PTM85704.1 TetR family transcriptional regulator [Dietzia psychralcaliphila]